VQLVFLLLSSQHSDHYFELVDSGFRNFQTFRCLPGVAGSLAFWLITVRVDLSGLKYVL